MFSVTVCKTDSRLQYAALRTLGDEIPHTEWVLKIEVSVPDAFRTSFNHWAMVLEVTTLCDLMIVTNSLVSSPLIDSVLLSYSLKVIIRHSSHLSRQNGKNKLYIVFPYLDRFA